MATPITKSLFPELSSLLSTPTETLMAQPIQAAQADRGDTLGYLRGQIRGLGAQAQQNIGTLFGQQPAAVAVKNQLTQIVQQVQATGVDIATPEGQIALAQELSKYPEFIGMATAMRQQAATSAQEAQLKQAQTIKALAEAQKATTEKVPAALEQADRIRLAELQQQFGATEGARRFREERDIAGERKAAAGVPQKQLGADINLRTDFLKEVRPIDDALSALDRAEALLNEQSGLADAIAKRQFAKFAGDRDISNKDVAAFGNFGPLGQRLGGILSQFFEGTYSDTQREEALRIIRNLRTPTEQRRFAIESQYTSAAERQGITGEAAKFVVPPRTRGLRPIGEAAPAATGQPKQTITLPSGNKATPL